MRCCNQIPRDLGVVLEGLGIEHFGFWDLGVKGLGVRGIARLGDCGMGGFFETLIIWALYLFSFFTE